MAWPEASSAKAAVAVQIPLVIEVTPSNIGSGDRTLGPVDRSARFDLERGSRHAGAPTLSDRPILCQHPQSARSRSIRSIAPYFSPRSRCCSRSEEHTSELQSLMRISYAVYCLKTKTLPTLQHIYINTLTLI